MRARQVVAASILVLVAGCSSDDVDPSEPVREGPAGEGPAPLPPEQDRRDPLAAALADEPPPPDRPSQAARLLLAADRAIQDRSTSPAQLAAAGHTQQVALRTLADHPRWDDPVARLLPAGVRRATADSVAARREFRSMHGTDPGDLATELPAWRIVAPRPASELRRYYREAQRRYGVAWEYLAAINLVETGFGRIKGTSVAGAQGPMQFIPTTWDIYGAGGDIHDPHDAILAAGRLLRANGFATDRSGALYRYNNSTAYVRGVTLYAQVMQRRPAAYLGYHQWPIYYLTRAGSVWLPEGYHETEPVPVRRWLADPG